MFKEPESRDVGLTDLLATAMVESDPEPPKPRAKLVGTFLATAVVMGLGLAGMAAPAAIAANDGITAVNEVWNQIPGDLPIEDALSQHTTLLDKDGKEFARFYSENRIDVSLDQVNSSFIDALLSTEDTRFYEHNGFDPIGMARAAASNIAGGSGTQGASTITQQLVQNILISNARTAEEEQVAVGTTYSAKLREMKYAVELEKSRTKDEILAMYVNAVYFGNGAYGIEAASRVYFDKHAKDLTVPESALLVGLLKNPSGYDPFKHPEASKDRRAVVLGRMLANGKLGDEELKQFAAAELGTKRGSIPSGCDVSDFPYYCAQVRNEIRSNPAFGETEAMRERTLSRGGMTLTTGLDRKAQKGAEKAVNGILGKDNRVKSGVAVVEPGTGHLAAIAQNTDWKDTEVIYATRAFQAGSAMKPFATVTGLEQGIPATTVMNTNGPYFPSGMDAPSGGFKNYGGNQYGNVSGYKAITMSANVYFVKLAQKTGITAVADTAKRLGISTLPANLTGREASLVLGSYEVTPLEMAGAFATFVSGGIHCDPVAVVSGVRTSTGEKISTSNANCHQAISPAVANTMGAALKGPLTESMGTLQNLGGGLSGGRPAGAKSGTTNGNAANWTVGVTPQLATAVWLGDPRGGYKYPLDIVHTSMGTFDRVNGAEIAGPIWKRTMDSALAGTPHKAMPKADNAATSQSSARRVPDVRGMELSQALDALERVGMKPKLNPETAERPEGVPENVIVKQSPEGSSTLGHHQEIMLTLGHGSNTEVSLGQ